MYMCISYVQVHADGAQRLSRPALPQLDARLLSGALLLLALQELQPDELLDVTAATRRQLLASQSQTLA